MSAIPISADTPLHVLFALAGKHAMDQYVRFARGSRNTADAWLAGFLARQAETWRSAALDHIAAAKKAKRLAG